MDNEQIEIVNGPHRGRRFPAETIQRLGGTVRLVSDNPPIYTINDIPTVQVVEYKLVRQDGKLVLVLV